MDIASPQFQELKNAEDTECAKRKKHNSKNINCRQYEQIVKYK